MTCFHPLVAYRLGDGPLSFAKCKRESGSTRLELPCGQCVGCRLRRVREWSIRCVHEAMLHDSNCFLTLTYDRDHLPVNGSLDKDHWQRCAKRMRYHFGPFRYFHCGEYGSTTYRPHYHTLVFGLDFPVNDTCSVIRVNPDGSKLVQSSIMDRIWGYGRVAIGSLTFNSAGYVAKYCMKASDDYAKERYTRYDAKTGESWQVLPEYATMSRRPGIGAAWFDKYSAEVVSSDEVVVDGRIFPVPRYYDNRMDDSTLDRLKERRKAVIAAGAGDMTPERLRDRERCLRSKYRRKDEV